MPADFADRTDFENANRGLIARLEPGVIKAADGRVVYDADAFTRATAGDCPDTVHPSLWRQSQLTAIQGLFEVTEGIYQLRGIELSNMTLVEGTTGVIVIDPAVSAEVAAAGLALYREHRGDRPVTAVIYTHSHIDHFGGVLGVVDADTSVPIVAPAGFLENAVSENVYAGGAMLRRGAYHTGMNLPIEAAGMIGVGLGSGTSMGTSGLVAPTLDITATGQEETLDGVRIVFQITPGTEAPAEMNFYFPTRRALCVAENVTHNLHNLLTLRGAQVRDARAWSRYIAEAIELFGDDAAGRVRLPPLAHLGHRQRAAAANPAARPVRVPARSDAAADEPGVRRQRDRRDDRDAAGPRGGLAHPRVLRLGQPQRQGDLPALPRLVRRQPGPPLAAPAGGRRRPLRAGHRRRRGDRGQGAGVRRRRRPAVRGRAGQPRGVRRPERRAGPGAARRRAHPAGLRRRMRDLAQQLPHRRPGAPRGPGRDRGQLGRDGARADHHPALRQPRDPHRRQARVGRHARRSGGTSPTPARPTGWSSATAP